jgi:hypothetical protein
MQLTCSSGDELLSRANLGSWANLGAIATGIDADVSQADICDLPADLVDQDLVYLYWGAIYWVPDLVAFAQIIATHFRPGRSVLLADHHPSRKS